MCINCDHTYEQLNPWDVYKLGVDNQLKISEQVSSSCRSYFFQLRQIRTIRRSLASDSTKTLVNAFVNSRLDYCNSLLYGVGEGLMDRLQRGQNAAAWLVSGAKKYDHITPIMMNLHWLPIRRRVTFKVATLVYKCLHGCAPVYIVDDNYLDNVQSYNLHTLNYVWRIHTTSWNWIC